MLEKRIIGICPMTEDSAQGLFWIYYPSLRPILAKEKVENKLYSNNITTIDDLFFFRDFNSILLPVTNVLDNNLTDNVEKENLSDAINKLELEPFEMEHESWQIILEENKR